MNRWSGRPRRAAGAWGPLVGLLLLVLAGCPTRDSAPKQGAGSATGPATVGAAKPVESADLAQAGESGIDAERLLSEMLATYRKTRWYRDEAVMVLSYRQNGQQVTDEAPMAVSLARPNRLKVRAFQVNLASNGRELRGRIDDPASHNVDNQFLVRPSPPTIRLADLLDDPLVEDQLGSGLVLPDGGRQPLQLAFLLAEKPVELVSGQDVRLKVLRPESIEGHECHCVEVTAQRGTYRFWVDAKENLLRRLEYPRSALIPRLAEAREVDDVRLVVHFRHASTSVRPDDDDFELEIPESARQVRFFVPPPQPLPTDKLGQVIEPLELTTPDGAKVNRESLGNRPAALLWFSLDDQCEPALRQFAQVRQSMADDGRVAFYAVATEPSTVGHQQLRDALRRWRAELPLVRDLAAHGRDQLGIDATPTLIVLDGAGALQLYEVGVNPQLAEQLPQVLEKVLAGEDLAATILKQQQLEDRQYRRRLEIASSESTATVEVPNVPIAEAAPPTKLALEVRWTNSQLKQPGNLVAIDAGTDAERVIVLDEGRRLVELNPADGSVVREFELRLPPDTTVQKLRTIVDKAGTRYYAAFSPQGSYVYLFQADGQLLWKYPDEEAHHEGIRDVLLADLDNDGTVECYIGFWGGVGLHGVSIEGKRLWTNRSSGSILSLALSPPNPVGWRKLLAIGSQGRLIRFNQFGNADPPQAIAGWTVAQLGGDPRPVERAVPLCGLGFDREGRYCAVALNDQLVEQWNYPLPEGVWRSAVELVAPTEILGQPGGGWLLAAVDGGVHLVSDDGEFSDFLRLGWLPTGLTSLVRSDGTRWLVAAGQPGVQAWEVK